MKPFAFVFFLFCGGLAQAQVTKLFFDKNHKALKDKDSSKASTFILKEKLADTGWYVKEYQTDGFILSEGMYRDEKMKMPQGKFIYYWIALKKEASTNPYYSYVQLTGSYSNGQKSGTWIKYTDQGAKAELLTYANGKLNGLYQGYTFPGYLYVDGSYQDDKREGEWHVYDKNGKVTVTDTYAGGQIINTVRSDADPKANLGSGVIVPSPKPQKIANGVVLTGAVAFNDTNTGTVQNAVPEKDFKTLLKRKISGMIENGTEGKLLVQFIVDQKGSVSSASIFKGTGKGQDVDIVNLIPGICSWKPALKDNQPAIQRIYCIIVMQNSQVEIAYSPNLNDVLIN